MSIKANSLNNLRNKLQILVLFFGVVVIISFVLVLWPNSQRQDILNIMPMPSTVFTPFPKITNPPVVLQPNENSVNEEFPLVPYVLNNNFSSVSYESQDSYSLVNTRYSRFYVGTDAGNKSYLRISVFPNGDFSTLEAFSTNFIKDYTVLGSSVFKIQNLNGVRYVFETANPMTIGEYSIVYVPGWFHVIGYTIEYNSGDNRAEVQSRVAQFMNSFLSKYDWAFARSTMQGWSSEEENKVLVQNEMYYQEHR